MEKQTLITVIDEVEVEAKRFLLKLEAYRIRSKEFGSYTQSTKQAAALRRAALDLKQELTKITQSIIY